MAAVFILLINNRSVYLPKAAYQVWSKSEKVLLILPWPYAVTLTFDG